MPKDDAWFIMNEIATLPNGIHFVDLNKTEQVFSLPYASQIRRCDETLRRIDLIALECKKMRVKVTKVGTIDNFNNCMLRVLQERKKAENLFLDDIEAEIQQKEQFLREQIEVLQDMSTNFNILLEHKSVVAVAAEVIKGAMEAEEVKRQSEIEEKKH
jgi:hypothetical protein